MYELVTDNADVTWKLVDNNDTQQDDCGQQTRHTSLSLTGNEAFGDILFKALLLTFTEQIATDETNVKNNEVNACQKKAHKCRISSKKRRRSKIHTRSKR